MKEPFIYYTVVGKGYRMYLHLSDAKRNRNMQNAIYPELNAYIMEMVEYKKPKKKALK